MSRRKRFITGRETDEFVKLVLRLAKLDPELVPETNDDFGDPYASFEVGDMEPMEIPVRATMGNQVEHRLARIQGALQAAIERRGWAWFVQATRVKDTEPTLTYIGDIDCLDGGGSQRTGSHPVIALLRAYMDVLDVQEDEEAA